jgi:hypothetical protein
MSRPARPSPGSLFRNAMAGSYGPMERLRVIANNVRRKAGGKGCCGNYGDPGC